MLRINKITTASNKPKKIFMIFFIINNYSNYYFGTIEPLNGSVVTKNLTFFSRKVSLDGTIEPYKRSNRLCTIFNFNNSDILVIVRLKRSK